MGTATFSVVVVEHAPKFYAGCVHCNTILGEGKWAIVMGLKKRYFMVGKFPRDTCCDAEVSAPFLFGSKMGARKKMEEVMKQIQTDTRKFDAFSYFPAENFFAETIQ